MKGLSEIEEKELPERCSTCNQLLKGDKCK
jgi:hypothetical protein